MSEFRGVIPPIITPFDAFGQIHAAALERLVAWYARAGCHGLWVCGGTGEGVSLSHDERLLMIDLAAEASAALPVIFHVGAPTTADAVAAARRCQAAGLAAICSVPPYFYGTSDQEVVDYYAALGDVTELPIFLYNLPDATGVPLRLPLVERIVRAVPRVVGLKHSGGVVDYVGELTAWNPEFQVLIGRGETTLPALTLGARGVVCASLCLAPERFVALYEAFVAGRLREALEAQREAAAVKRVFLRYGVISAVKRVNAAQIGLECGAGRAPLAPIHDADEPGLLALAEDLGLLAETSPMLADLAERRPR